MVTLNFPLSLFIIVTLLLKKLPDSATCIVSNFVHENDWLCMFGKLFTLKLPDGYYKL
jgi:hypothetical protein